MREGAALGTDGDNLTPWPPFGRRRTGRLRAKGGGAPVDVSGATA